jgi:hypothetical protein
MWENEYLILKIVLQLQNRQFYYEMIRSWLKCIVFFFYLLFFCRVYLPLIKFALWVLSSDWQGKQNVFFSKNRSRFNFPELLLSEMWHLILREVEL